MLYDKHIFICTNERAQGARVSCGEAKGMELVSAFKKALKEKQLTIPIRTQRAGCFDFCELGPNVVIYPEGVFYGPVTLSDVNEIIERHIEKGEIVERLRITKERLKTKL